MKEMMEKPSWVRGALSWESSLHSVDPRVPTLFLRIGQDTLRLYIPHGLSRGDSLGLRTKDRAGGRHCGLGMLRSSQ